MSATPTSFEQKKTALELALGQIKRQYGEVAVMNMGDTRPLLDTEVISTGSLGLDMALGAGGLPKGRIVEIYSPEFS